MELTADCKPRREGGVHTIDARRSRAIFGFVLVVGAVMSSAFCAEIGIPLALMLSADPLPRSDQRA